MRVLVVDDHQMIRDGIKWMLVTEPTVEVVGEAAEGSEAIAVAAKTLPDVVLLDVRMQGVPGLETLVSIKERWPDMAVLMLTMYDDPNLVAAAIGQGASGYLLKSAGRDEMIEAIHRVGDGGSYLQGILTKPLVDQLRDDGQQKTTLQLSPQDCRILELISSGSANREIAAELQISEPLVKAALQRIFKALHATGRSEAVGVAFRMGFIS